MAVMLFCACIDTDRADVNKDIMSTTTTPTAGTTITDTAPSMLMQFTTSSLARVGRAASPFRNCTDVITCLKTSECRQCIEAMNASAITVHTDAEWHALSLARMKEVETLIIRVLLFNPGCVATGNASSRTIRNTLDNTLMDLGTAGTMHIVDHACSPNDPNGWLPNCTDRFGLAVGPCAQIAFAVGSPRYGPAYSCMSEIFATNMTNETLYKAFNSPACQDISYNQEILSGVYGTQSDTMAACVAFPTCSYLKHICRSSSECAPCLLALERGDGVRAARLCPFR